MLPNKMLTVGELRAALQNCPNDMPVLIIDEDMDVMGVVCSADAEQPMPEDTDPIYRDKGVLFLQLNNLDDIESIKSMEGDLSGALRRFLS